MKAYLYYSKESFNKRIDVPRLKRTIADVLSAEFNCLSGVEAGDIVITPAKFSDERDMYLIVVTPLDDVIWNNLQKIKSITLERIQEAISFDQGDNKNYIIKMDIKENYTPKTGTIEASEGEKKMSDNTDGANEMSEMDYKKRAEMYVPIEPSYSFDRVILPSDVKEKIEEALSILQYERKVFGDWGLYEIQPRPSSSMSFFGPSGTGKTMAAEAIAQKLGKKILKVSYADVESKYHGEGPKMVKAIFMAAERDDAVLFFDEADSLLSKRLTNVSQGSEQAINSMRSQLLICLEEFKGIVIFATNLVINYDHAFLTRLISVEFVNPDVETRKKIWDVHIRPADDGRPHKLNIPLGKDVDSAILAEKYNFVGREIRNAVISACIAAAMDGKDIVGQGDFIKACDKIVKEKQSLAMAKDHTEDSRAQEVVKQALIERIKGGATDVSKNPEE